MNLEFEAEHPIILLDLGSKRVKGLYLDNKFKTRRIESYDAKYVGEGVIDTKDYLDKVLKIIKVFLKQSTSKDYLLGITGQRASIVGWSKDLNVVTPTYTWRSESGYLMYRKIRERRDLGILEMFLQPGAGILRVGYIKDKYSDVDFIGGIESLVIYRLFNDVFTDYSFGYSYGVLDPLSLNIIDDIVNILDIDLDKIPRFLPLDEIDFTGELDGYTLYLKSVLSDQSSALASEGCFTHGCGKITLGTGAFIDLYTGEEFIGDPSIGVNPMLAWVKGVSATYMAEYFIYHAGDSLDWVSELYKCDEGASKIDFKDLPLYLPSYSFLTTESRKRFDGAIYRDLKLSTSLKELYFAVFSSASYLISRGIKRVSELAEFNKIYVSGGWSNSNLLLNLIALFSKQKLYVRKERSYSTLYGLIPFIIENLGIKQYNMIDVLRPIEETIEPEEEYYPSEYIEKLESLYEATIK